MNSYKKIVHRLTGGIALATIAAAPSLAQYEEKWDTAGFIENATFYRDGPGLTKSRTTGQFEFSKDFGKHFGLNNFRLSGTLRATYDAVYDLNDDEFGDNAGGPRNFENFGSLLTLLVAMELRCNAHEAVHQCARVVKNCLTGIVSGPG